MTETTLRAWAWLTLVVAAGCGAETEPPPAPEPAPEPPAEEAPPPDDLYPLRVRPDAVPAPTEARTIPDRAQRHPSGRFASRVLVEGEGEVHPGPYDAVTIHYTAWRAGDGHMFDNTRTDNPAPAHLFLGDVFASFRDGIGLMVVGEARRFWFPQNPVEPGRPGNRPTGMLVFDIELVALRAALAPPEPMSEPPEDAGRSESGLRWRIVEPGTGTAHPEAETRVEIEYGGWRAETGEMFAGTHVDGRPWRRAVGAMLPGLQEGLPMMVAGERRIFWIPADLAYEGEDGPQGMLVFDVKLLRL